MKVAFHTGREKYIATLAGEEQGDDNVTEEELYDLVNDPGEGANMINEPSLAGRREAFRRDLRAFLDEAKRFRAGQDGEEVVVDEAVQERLKALGYVQ